MNIRILLSTAFSLALCSSALSVEAKARLLGKDGSNKDVLVLEYTKNAVSYQISVRNPNKEKVATSGLEGIYFYEPEIYAEALGLYNSGDFKAAKKLFTKCENDFKSVAAAKGNYSTLAGFYKSECSRRMFDFKSLAAEQAKLNKSALIQKRYTDQLELNAVWLAVGAEDWAKVESLAAKWEGKEISNSQLAQVIYCQALALEKTSEGDPVKMESALSHYYKVMVIDHALSKELVVSATKNLLDIYLDDPAVKKAITLWGSKVEDVNSEGYAKLTAGSSLAATYQASGLEKVKPLSSAHKRILKYKVAPKKSNAPKPEAVAEKPEDKKKAEEKPAQKAPTKKKK